MITNSRNDVFDEDAKELDIEDKQWEKLMSYRMKDGLRDGMTDGHESCLQDSFNQGFHDGFRSLYNVSLLRGISRTFCLKGLEADTSSKIYEKLGGLENSVLEALKDSVHVPSVSQDLNCDSKIEPLDLSETASSNMNRSVKLNDTKKLEIEGSFIELKEQCLDIARNLNNASLASTITAISF